MKLGLALAGGGMRGIAHAGFLKALEENNIEKTLEDVKDVKSVSVSNEPSMVELYLNKMDPLNMSPMEALSALMELKKLLGK